MNLSYNLKNHKQNGSKIDGAWLDPLFLPPPIWVRLLNYLSDLVIYLNMSITCPMFDHEAEPKFEDCS